MLSSLTFDKLLPLSAIGFSWVDPADNSKMIQLRIQFAIIKAFKPKIIIGAN
jgi:hypothetical protein